MTANQIAYQANLERERANKAQEQLTASAQAETHRSNLVREAETERANRAKEETEKVKADAASKQAGAAIANSVTGGIKNVSAAIFG